MPRQLRIEHPGLARIRKDVQARGGVVPDRELPQPGKLTPKPELATILAAAEAALGPANKYARKSAILISHRNTAYSLREIGDFYHLSTSAVSQICHKMEKELRFNSSLAEVVQEIGKRLPG